MNGSLFRIALGVALALGIATSGAAAQTTADALERHFEARRGLVVHLGCGDGALVEALAGSGRYAVQGLTPSQEQAKRGRDRLMVAGVLGNGSLRVLPASLLPYADRLVNALVVSDPCDVPVGEMRALGSHLLNRKVNGVGVTPEPSPEPSAQAGTPQRQRQKKTPKKRLYFEGQRKNNAGRTTKGEKRPAHRRSFPHEPLYGRKCLVINVPRTETPISADPRRPRPATSSCPEPAVPFRPRHKSNSFYGVTWSLS